MTTRVTVDPILNVSGATCDYDKGQCTALATYRIELFEVDTQDENTAQVRRACEEHAEVLLQVLNKEAEFLRGGEQTD